MANRNWSRAARVWDLDDLRAERGWNPRGSTPDVRPPYFASYGPDGEYDPAGNWAAARRTGWGVRSSGGLGGYGIEGAPGLGGTGGYGPEGDYGEFGRGTARYGTANVTAGAGMARPENYAGRGPRGYRRADSRIQEDVNDALTRDPELDATDVEVSVENGEVTLTGTVGDRRAKRRAEDDAYACAGVHDVHNRLTTGHGASAHEGG
jgi:hypothetical protein